MNIRKEGGKGRKKRYQIEGNAHGPYISSAQHRPVVPVILEFKVGRWGVCRRPRVERALQFCVDVHVSLFLGVGAILDRSGPRHARVPECGSRGHEKGVVDVPRVGEYREVERQEPGFAPRDDAEVRRSERGVREDVVERRGVVVLEIVERCR
jgi:hypothetical protein